MRHMASKYQAMTELQNKYCNIALVDCISYNGLQFCDVMAWANDTLPLELLDPRRLTDHPRIGTAARAQCFV